MSVKISVVIPIYKTEKYLDRCLSSVRNQTFKDIEIICVDDCSPDKSFEIVEKHMAQDSRISLIRHSENLGLGGARNTAILSSKADWIASVDSDDHIHPEMLSRLWDASEGGEYDIVSCGFDRINSKDEVLSSHAHKSRTLDNTDDQINIFSNVNPAFWNKLWKKSLFVENSIFFPKYVYYQDSATTPRLLAKSNKIKIIDDRLYNYLIREDSATYTSSAKHLLDYLKVFDVLLEFLKDNNLFKRYKADFLDYVDRCTRFHSQNILESQLDDFTARQYLRHFLMLKMGFLEYSGLLEGKSKEEISVYLSSARTRADLLPPDWKEVLPISVVVKTFLRPEILERILHSIGNYEQKNGVRFDEIIVGDDSPNDVIGANARAIKKTEDIYPHINIVHDKYEENIGLSEGRNRMVKRAKNECIMLCDDDFIFDEEADVKKALSYIQKNEFDMVGGWLKNNYNLTNGDYSYWGAQGKIIETSNELVINLCEVNLKNMPDIQVSDYLLNFYLARRSVLLDNPWDALLKVEEHQEFFYRFYKNNYRAGLCKHLFVKHTADRNENPPRYNDYRFGKENWEYYLYLALDRMGKRRRTINRVRKDSFSAWTVDAEKRTNLQRSVPLREPIVAQQVPVTCVTPAYENHFFGYYDVRSESEDGKYIICQDVPAIDRLPTSDDIASIKLIDAKSLVVERIIGKTSAWCHQQGAHLQFIPNKRSRVIYNIFNEEENCFQSVEIDIDSDKSWTHPHPVAAIAPNGKKAASINFSRLYDYRPGYGYNHIPDPEKDNSTPVDDGLTIFDLETGEADLILSYAQISKILSVGWWERYRDDKWVINHVSYSPDGSKLLMLIRVFSDDAPFPTFTVVCNSDGSNLRRVFGFCSHYHWKDNTTFVASGAPGFTRQKARVIKVYEVNTDTLEYSVIADGLLNGDGHCSYSPDRSLLLYDSYASTAFPYRRLQVYRFETNEVLDLAYFYSPGKWFNNNPDLRCDLHPRWSTNGKTITFDSIHEGFRGVYSIDVSDVIAAFDNGIKAFTDQDIRRWYSAKYEAPVVDRTQKQLVKKPQKHFGTLYKEARLEYFNKNYSLALKLFEECMKMSPKNANLKRCAAEVLIRLDRTDDALILLNEALTLIPENKNLYWYIKKIKNPYWMILSRRRSFKIPPV